MKKNQKTQKPLFVRVVVELDSTERTLTATTSSSTAVATFSAVGMSRFSAISFVSAG
jgi:hypothetical protein